MYNKLILSLLAAQGAQAVQLKGDAGDLSTAGTDWTLKQLDKEVGDLKWTRPHEQEVFDLGGVLDDFYNQIAFNYGGENYGEFAHHGNQYDAYEPVETTFHYNEGTPTKSYWNPFPTPSGDDHYSVHLNEPVAQAYAHGYTQAPADDHDDGYEQASRTKFRYTVPEVHYPDPKPYSYSVTQPSILYREVEHIAPEPYESPELRDLAEIETYPEGYTNEYDEYQIENYFGSDGSDHRHFNYDNIDWIDLDHGHFDPDPHAKVRPFQPAWDQYFVPTVNTPAPEANYSGRLDRNAEAKSLTYFDAEFGVYRYLYDNSLVPG